MPLLLTRREVTAALALAWAWAAARGAGLAAEERGAVPSVDQRLKRLEQQLEDLRQALGIPGLSAAIAKDGTLL